MKLSGSLVFGTWYFSDSAQGLHDVADVLLQQDGLLVGFEGAGNQFGQQLVGGDAGTARQAQFAVDGAPQLGGDVGAQRQPGVIGGADLCVCAETRRSACCKLTVCSNQTEILRRQTHWKDYRRVQKTKTLQASLPSASPPFL